MATKPVAADEVTGTVDGVEDIIDSFLSARGVGSHDRADVVFDSVAVEGSGRGIQVAPTVRTAAWSLLNFFNPLKYRPKPEQSRTLLHEFSGTVKGGEMLLVIGKPGSGCTTFLKTMSGMHEEYKSTTGGVTYAGRTAHEVKKDSPADIVFCAEDDDHFPTLTVNQVLRFAVKSRWDSKASNSQVEAAVGHLAELVGLQKVLNTKVGNAYIRGVSGGERRRVSLAEVLATCAACICLDSPTNGLDSTTAIEFMQMMRKFTDRLRCATAMTVYQGSDSIVPLFDKILVIHSGRQIYYGEASNAKAYFEGLGFECAPTTTITDFLNSMTAGPEARTARPGYQHRIPVTALDFENAFRASGLWNTVLASVKISKEQLVPDRADKKYQSYALPFYYQIWLCACRQARVFITDYHTWGSEAIIITIQSVLLGTVFRNQQHQTSSFSTLESALFYAVLVPALQSMAEFHNTFAQEGLVLKHKRYCFYRPSAYAFGLIATDIFWKVFAIAYNIPLYWLTNFQRTPGHFFIWFLTVYIEHMALSMIFRFLAVLSPNANAAILPVGLIFNFFVLYVSLYIPAPQMQDWLGWLRYLNPLYYGFGSLMVNEYSSLNYNCSEADLAPNGPGYSSIANQVCAIAGSVSGEGTVSGASYLRAQYGFQTSDLWRNIGINAAFFVAFAVSTAVGMEFLKLPAGKLATIFYKTEPRKLTVVKSSASSDTEKGDFDDDLPPVSSRPIESSLIQGHLSRKEEHVFTWKGICVDVKIGESEKRLLDRVDGWAENGQLTALMGVSGAGKTTLLNTLAGRLNFGTLSGDLFLNGRPLPKSFSRYMGYVQQQDIHLPTQTVREALQLTARLRRPAEISQAEKDAYVESVIEMLEMEDFADALIGVPGAGLNLRQRKQVTIGVELAAKPDILFLDEPSTGLDGQSAVSVIRLLRKLSNLGQAIVCTIHQPAAEVIYYFDTLFLLTTGGRTVYHGPLGKDCSLALEYFSTYGRPCAERENPAEYFLDVIGAGSRKHVSNDWAEIWQTSDTRKKRETVLAAKTSVTDHDQLSRTTKFDRTYGASFISQLRVVLHRTWLFYWREPGYASSKLWMHVGNALVNALTYLQLPSTVSGAHSRIFSVFMALVVGPPLALQVQPRFVALRDIFIHREKASLTYNWAVFVISAIVIELPYAFFASLIYWILWYYPVGYFYDSNHAGYSFLMFELFIIFATSIAQLSAAIMPQLTAAFTANGCLFVLLNTFTGTLTPRPVTPTGWRWFYNVSPLFYLSEGMSVNALHDLRITCTSGETNTFEPPSGMSCGAYARDFLTTATGYLVNPEANSSCSYCRYKDGQSYYGQYGYRWDNRYRDIGIFIGFIAFNYTFVILMTYLTKVRRWNTSWLFDGTLRRKLKRN